MKSCLLASVFCLFSAAAISVNAAERAEIPFTVIGQITPRAARDIDSSDWSIGCETLDRDFARYDSYKTYLGPLGAKGVRLQAGWAKTEQVPGRYNWAWLDAIINDAVAQGTRPWVQLSYGNPAYVGGGSKAIGEGGPTSPEALAAWDRWARALVHRYRDRVTEWEIWNEPDHSKVMTFAQYVDLFIRSAEIVRQEQPDGKVYGYAGGSNPEYAGKFLDELVARGKLDLVDALTFHTYTPNPDTLWPYPELKAIVAKYPRKIPLREGETGAPSQKTTGAMRNLDWTETKQTKWVLRRMLAYHGNDVPFSLFTLSDFMYPNGLNAKGLVAIDPATRIANRKKPSYSAAQSVFAIFDTTWKVDPHISIEAGEGAKLAMYGYRRNNHALVTLWQSQAVPADDDHYQTRDVAVRGGTFSEPVLVDLRTSTVYELPKALWSSNADGTKFEQLPLYDSPILIADRAELRIQAN